MRHFSAWVGGVTAADGADFGYAHDVRNATKGLTKAYNGAEGICQASSSSTSMVGFWLCEMSLAVAEI